MTDQHQQTVTGDRWFLGTRLRVVSDAATTNGQLTVLEQWAPAGFSPPLHVHHREDTALQVLDGEITVAIADSTHRIGPGDFAWLPRDVPHTFRVDSDDAHFLEYATPGGIEAFQIDASEPARGPGLPEPAEPDIAMLIAAFALHDGQILGPPLQLAAESTH